jgi:hypothetical protein
MMMFSSKNPAASKALGAHVLDAFAGTSVASVHAVFAPLVGHAHALDALSARAGNARESRSEITSRCASAQSRDRASIRAAIIASEPEIARLLVHQDARDAREAMCYPTLGEHG